MATIVEEPPTKRPKSQPDVVIISSDLSEGQERHAILVVNETGDGEVLPSDFRYSAAVVETPSVSIPRETGLLSYCLCRGDCSSDDCACATSFEMAALPPERASAYDGNGRLWPECLDGPGTVTLADVVVECGPDCPCSPDCPNRRVQRGIQWRLVVFRRSGVGWAVRAAESIPKGAFVTEYAGELLPELEADVREDDSFFFEIGAPQPSTSGTFVLDAKWLGNVARFINHSCSPNVIPCRVLWDHAEPGASHLAFFALKDILPGQEICLDYGEKWWCVKGEEISCACNSENCKYSKDKIQDFLREYALRKSEAQPELY